MKSKLSALMVFVLWSSMVLAMISSVSHLAAQFGSLEPAGSHWRGWLAAVAIDAAILSLSFGLRQRRRSQTSNLSKIGLWSGLLFLVVISVVANFKQAIINKPGAYDEAALFSATLPIIVLLLAEILSSDTTYSASGGAVVSRVSDSGKAVVSGGDSGGAVVSRVSDSGEDSASGKAVVSRVSDSGKAVVSGSDSVSDKKGFMAFMATANGDRPQTPGDVARLFNVSDRTAYRWFKDWQDTVAEKV